MTAPPLPLERPPVALTIAGSDSSGSSGLQADLPTFAANGAHGATVMTVVTAQDTNGVHRVHPLPVELVAAQLEAVVGDLRPQATKTGMLWSVEVVAVVEAAAARGALGALTVDPVLVDSAGRRLVDDAAVDAYRRLASASTLFTPNRWEAELLVGHELPDTAAVVAAAPALSSLGADVVVVTGGRSEGDVVADVVITRLGTDDGERRSGGEVGVIVAESPKVGVEPVRGTGCTFSAAATALLARGAAPLDAVEGARRFVARQLRRRGELRPGSGRPGVPHRCDPPDDTPPDSE